MFSNHALPWTVNDGDILYAFYWTPLSQCAVTVESISAGQSLQYHIHINATQSCHLTQPASCVWTLGRNQRTHGKNQHRQGDKLKFNTLKGPHWLLFKIYSRTSLIHTLNQTTSHISCSPFHDQDKSQWLTVESFWIHTQTMSNKLHVKRFLQFIPRNGTACLAVMKGTTTKKLCCLVPLPSHNYSNKVGEAR